ncbi:CYTH and CHAD domain-containing protein [Quatrionicoccus australiensis]|uniref:CYTH and CHAD domain-containing protein n=1 Tax=Quatrionicoccus australiensis TaxID=138118 RepID=UPI001CF9403D|nr:CYTH and CHAD domain-containing protein [Quatrionicoccus australiensis]MCB4360814.1 CHAD domain-containing protein [Quatrionicoccus australiensis]
MSTEIELKLQLTPKAAKQLGNHPLLADITPQKQRLLNTYFDTPELQLHARRIAIRFRQKGWQWLLTVKSAEPASGGLAMRSEWETEATPGNFNFSHVDNDELRHFLEDATEHLEPVFTTDFRRQIWHVPFGESLIELAVDRGSIESRGKSTPICEIELELLCGTVEDIFGLTRQLQADLNLVPAIASKAERGYNLFTNTPLRPFRAKTAPLTPEQTPVEAFRQIALGCLEHFQRNEPGLLSSNDLEFVHQARVALRRLRSAIKLFAPVLPAQFVSAYGQTWKTLASALGDARNWDVFLTETLPPIQTAFPDNRDIKQLRNAARRRAKAARQAITRILAGREYPRLLVEFTAATYALGDVLPTPLPDFAESRIAAYIRRAKKLANRHAQLTSTERHRMRIYFKKLRYAIEFMTPLIPPKNMKTGLINLAHLQDTLGLINDLVTAEQLIEEVFGEKSTTAARAWIAGQTELLLDQLPEVLMGWVRLTDSSLASQLFSKKKA